MSDPTLIIDDSNNQTPRYDHRGATNQESNPIGNVTVVEGGDYTKKSQSSERKVVGFFVSYSHKETGEYWPIYMGENKVGSSSGNHIILKEASVSKEHAKLVVRLLEDEQDESKNRLVLILTDNNATSGTKVNGVDLFKTGLVSEVKAGDIVRFGLRYKLLLFFVDTAELGLAPDPKFQSIGAADDAPKFDYSQREPNKTRVYSNQ